MSSGCEEAISRGLRAAAEVLYRVAGAAPPSVFDPRSWRGRLIRRAITDEELRSALFRLVDVLPVLADAAGIAAHVRDYLGPQSRRTGRLWKLAFAAGGQRWAAPAVRHTVEGLARQFVAEDSAASLRRVIAEAARIPAALSLDVVGETVLGEAEADRYAARYLSLLDTLERERPRLRGRPPVQISIKLSALSAIFDPLAEDQVRRRVFGRIRPIVERLRQLGGGLTIDMEQYERKPLVLNLFRRLVETEGEGEWAPGIALQAYLPETERDLTDLIAWGRKRGRRIVIRLVKGAYWDTEMALAAQRGWSVPVFRDKADTDKHYERLIDLLFQHADVVRPAVASHNLRSLAYAWNISERRGLAPEAWEVQMLYGMAEPLRRAVVQQGLQLRIYLPVGELIPGIAYLIRRLMENTADTSILRQAYVDGASLDQLVAPPASPLPPSPTAPPFLPVPLRDFSQAASRENFGRALAFVRTRLGFFHPLAIEGVRTEGAGLLEERNPAAPAEILGRVAVAGRRHAEQAVANAVNAFPEWRNTPLDRRIALCRKVADLIEVRRDRLAAWEVLEAGKNWREADADVAEAADYFRYYALQMEALAGWKATMCFPGEDNHWRYEPRGVAVIISPWNFPLAILAGMTAAALAAGNTVIMKPASSAVLVACQLHAVLLEAGFAANVCQLLPGGGEEVGGGLVTHPKVHLIAFTGSREVGMEILRLAHRPGPGQKHVKQVVCEMGGKNAVIVDRDADLDEAVQQILHSAFGYQGQKCSAASRVIAVGDVHDRLVERLTAALDSYPYGPPEDPAFMFGPLISAAAVQKVRNYLDIGRREARLHYLGRAPEDGYYHPAAIFTDVEPSHRLAREEIFGPLLAVLRVPNFEAALNLALDSDYALTGGVFSRLPSHLALARRRFRVGNLYLNRRITGARVGIQPFGGVALSGTGVQAGGPDYLKQFLWTRVVSENTLRHGFVPGGAG